MAVTAREVQRSGWPSEARIHTRPALALRQLIGQLQQLRVYIEPRIKPDIGSGDCELIQLFDE